jgi:tetratricopeptide (TPR) repeat protein
MARRSSLLLHFWPWGFILMLVALFVLSIVATPLYRTAKGWRASFYLKEAQEALAKGDHRYAAQRAKLCLQYRNDSAEAYRILAKVADARRDARSLNLWTTVLQANGGGTDADRVALGEAAMRENMLMVAQRQLDLLLVRPTPTKEVYNLAGLLSARQRRPALARSWFLKALAIDPEYARADMNLAQVQLLMPDNAMVEKQGLERLLELGKRNDEWGLQSLRLLTEWTLSAPNRRPPGLDPAEMLEKHPLAKLRDRCLAAQWKIQNYPEKKNAVIEAMLADVKDLSESDQRDLGAWLNGMRLYEKTLSVFPLDPRSPEPLMLVQLDAMAAMGRWQELDKFLEQDLMLEQPVLLWLFRARTAKELNRPTRYDLCWKQAVRAAGNQPLALRYLAYYAETLGDLPRSTQAHENLSQIPEYEMEALLALIRPYEKLGRTADLLKVMKRLLLLRPDDPTINNDVTYLSLLLNDTSLEPFERARKVYESDPQLPPFAVTYALAQLRGGLPAVALKVMRNFRLDQLTAPSWQAVYAATLDANGLKADALKLARVIDYKNLKPEEKQLIAGFWKPETPPAAPR